MTAIVSITNLSKTYDGGFQALKNVSLDIQEGEILALLGPNGAGKTTLISTVCGITEPTGGSVTVGGHDIHDDFRDARRMIGLVPQEIALEMFTSVINQVRFTRGLYGKPRDDAYIDSLLDQLSLSDKRGNMSMMLSGGMKRRVMIAKALSHRPRVLFLDEPTAGVDVELRKGMWDVVRGLKAQGVTIILTTHYIEEAEEMADRIAVINGGEILLVEEKQALIQRLGQKHLRIELMDALDAIPPGLDGWALGRAGDGRSLIYTYDRSAERSGITRLLNDLAAHGVQVSDIETQTSSLEDIFVDLIHTPGQEAAQ